jgi:uncharacterized protein YjiS (DUF1127 family)
MAALFTQGVVQPQHQSILNSTAGNPRMTEYRSEVGTMAQAERIEVAQLGLLEGLRGIARDFQEKRARHRLYRQTVRELNSLSSRELADLGYHRSMIRRLAHEAAYGA